MSDSQLIIRSTMEKWFLLPRGFSPRLGLFVRSSFLQKSRGTATLRVGKLCSVTSSWTTTNTSMQHTTFANVVLLLCIVHASNCTRSAGYTAIVIPILSINDILSSLGLLALSVIFCNIESWIRIYHNCWIFLDLAHVSGRIVSSRLLQKSRGTATLRVGSLCSVTSSWTTTNTSMQHATFANVVLLLCIVH